MARGKVEVIKFEQERRKGREAAGSRNASRDRYSIFLSTSLQTRDRVGSWLFHECTPPKLRSVAACRPLSTFLLSSLPWNFSQGDCGHGRRKFLRGRTFPTNGRPPRGPKICSPKLSCDLYTEPYSSTKQIVRVHSVNRIACKRRNIDMKPSNGRFLVSEKALSDVSCQEGG